MNEIVIKEQYTKTRKCVLSNKKRRKGVQITEFYKRKIY